MRNVFGNNRPQGRAISRRFVMVGAISAVIVATVLVASPLAQTSAAEQNSSPAAIEVTALNSNSGHMRMQGGGYFYDDGNYVFLDAVSLRPYGTAIHDLTVKISIPTVLVGTSPARLLNNSRGVGNWTDTADQWTPQAPTIVGPNTVYRFIRSGAVTAVYDRPFFGFTVAIPENGGQSGYAATYQATTFISAAEPLDGETMITKIGSFYSR